MSASDEEEGKDIIEDATGEPLEEPDPLEELLEERESREEDNTAVDDELAEFQEPSYREQIMSKLGGLKKYTLHFLKKFKLTDRRLANMSQLSEYLMFAFITAAILTVIGFGINLAIAGLAVPFIFYLQIFIGTIISAVGFFVLVVILDGGADYLAARLR